MKPEYLWAVGLAIALGGELWGVFTRAPGDTITEYTFRHPVGISIMCALLFWAIWHFVVARGQARIWDLAAVALGAVVGVLVWIFNRPKKDNGET